MQFDIRHVMYDTGDNEKLWAEHQEEVFIGDSLRELEFNVENENGNRRGKLVEISGGVFPFVVELPNGSKQFFSLAYPIPVDETKVIHGPVFPVDTKPEQYPEPAEIGFEPYKSREEIIEHVTCKYNMSVPVYAMSLIWIRHKESKNVLLVTGFLNNGIFADTFYSFEELFNKFEYTDGTPCGLRLV